MFDRRIRRTTVPSDALRMLLDSQRARLGSDALAVGAADGRVLATSGTAARALLRDALEGRPGVASWQLATPGGDVVVASRGARMSHELGAGVKRILG